MCSCAPCDLTLEERWHLFLSGSSSIQCSVQVRKQHHTNIAIKPQPIIKQHTASRNMTLQYDMENGMKKAAYFQDEDHIYKLVEAEFMCCM